MKYFAMIDGVQKGPFTLEELPGAGVRPSTYIWCKGMADWEKAEDNADVCRLFRNHLYDIMHPTPKPVETTGIGMNQPSGTDFAGYTNPSPTRFDAFLRDDPNSHIPTLEEIEAQHVDDIPPVSMVGYAWIAMLLFCLPTGLAALIFAYKSKSAWKEGRHKEAHDFCRQSKMLVGISFFLGIILYSFILFSF